MGEPSGVGSGSILARGGCVHRRTRKRSSTRELGTCAPLGVCVTAPHDDPRGGIGGAGKLSGLREAGAEGPLGGNSPASCREPSCPGGAPLSQAPAGTQHSGLLHLSPPS